MASLKIGIPAILQYFQIFITLTLHTTTYEYGKITTQSNIPNIKLIVKYSSNSSNDVFISALKSTLENCSNQRKILAKLFYSYSTAIYHLLFGRKRLPF